MKAKYAILERAITKYEDWKIVKFEIRIPKRGQRFSQILRAGISPGNNNARLTFPQIYILARHIFRKSVKYPVPRGIRTARLMRYTNVGIRINLFGYRLAFPIFR